MARGLALGSALVLLCWLSSARADAIELDKDAVYDAALDRALSAHAAGDYVHAEGAMREAHALSPSARTYRGLGVILYAEGRYLEAVEPLESALSCEQRALDGALRAGVEELLARLFQRVGRLALRFEPPGSTLRVDGSAPKLRKGGEILLLPGEHQIQIEAPDHEPYALSLRTMPGSHDSLHVVLAKLRAPAAQGSEERGDLLPTAKGAPLSSTKRRGAEFKRWWQPVQRNSVLGAGAALALAGGTTWLIGYLRYRDLYDHCKGKGGCDESERERSFKAKHIGALTTTGATLAAGGAAVLLIATGIELWQRSERKRLQVGFSLSELRVSGQF